MRNEKHGNLILQKNGGGFEDVKEIRESVTEILRITEEILPKAYA